MPKRLETSRGDADDLVPIQVMVPRWMKNRCVERAAATGKSLSDWVRDRIAPEVGEREPDSRKKR